MKEICSVLSVLVVVLTLFAATNVSAVCDSKLPAGYCFDDNGAQVEIVADPLDPNANFPQINAAGNSVFKYKITNTGNKTINFIDILIPECTPSLGDPLNPTGASPGKYKFFAPGAGDPNTGFGLGLKPYRTYQWGYSGVGEISFTMNGRVHAYPNSMFLNRGTGNFAYGQILSPSCAEFPYRAFIEEVPETVQKEVLVKGVPLCVESTDGTGCPTAVFSCEVPIESVCSCPGVDQNNPGDRYYWERGSIKDVGIGQGNLLQAWGEHDARCPRTWWQTKGSCKLYNSYTGWTGNGTYPGVSGYVQYFDVGTNKWKGLSGVTMKACQNGVCSTTIKTDSTGFFSHCFPPAGGWTLPWNGTLTPVKTGLAFTPDICGNLGTIVGQGCSFPSGLTRLNTTGTMDNLVFKRN